MKFEFEAILNDNNIKIERVFYVDSEMPMKRFTNLIMFSFGMTNSHLHEYTFKDSATIMTSRQLMPDLELEKPESVILEDDVIVGEVFKEEGSEVILNYDFSLDWNVRIRRIPQSSDYSEVIEEFGIISMQGEGILDR